MSEMFCMFYTSLRSLRKWATWSPVSLRGARSATWSPASLRGARSAAWSPAKNLWRSHSSLDLKKPSMNNSTSYKLLAGFHASDFALALNDVFRIEFYAKKVTI